MPRPSSITPEMEEEICEHIGCGGNLTDWCAQDGHPSFHSVFRALNSRPAFRESYAQAREIQAHADADRINSLSEAIGRGEIGYNEGRVMIDALKWTASRRCAKAYSERLQVAGDTTGPISITWAGDPTPR